MYHVTTACRSYRKKRRDKGKEDEREKPHKCIVLGWRLSPFSDKKMQQEEGSFFGILHGPRAVSRDRLLKGVYTDDGDI